MPDIVSDLVATTHCNGQRIDLSWTNPAAFAYVKVVRRQRNWVFDLTDFHEVVYESDVVGGGAPLIEELADTGIASAPTAVTSDIAAGDTSIDVGDTSLFNPGDYVRIEQMTGEYVWEIGIVDTVVSPTELQLTGGVTNAYSSSNSSRVALSSPLEEGVFYYYTVVGSSSDPPSPITNVDIDINTSNAFALSIARYDSKEDFFWKNTPDRYRYLDETGFLDAWNTVMGCWLNTLRGHAKSTALLNDGDQTPFNTLSAKVRSLGTDPDGFSYDLEIPRKLFLSLANIYQRRGTCTGMIRAVSAFTDWNTECIEFGVGNCRSGSSPMLTWDGESESESYVNTPAFVTLANRSLTDIDIFTRGVWIADTWLAGFLIGGIGDVCCVASNDETVLTLEEPDRLTTLDGAVIIGATTIPVASTTSIIPGLTLQLEQVADYTKAEIVEVDTVTPGVSFTTKEPILNAYSSGDYVSIGKSLIRDELLCSGGVWSATISTLSVVANTNPVIANLSPVVASAASGALYDLYYAKGGWTENQWAGYKVISTDNKDFDIVSNTGDTLTVLAGAHALPANGAFAIAKDYTVGGSFAARTAHIKYSVYNRVHALIFEPTLDIETIGTIHDPFYRLWNGNGLTLAGAWGSADVGLRVTDNVAIQVGKSSAVSGAVFDLDTTLPAPAINEYAGYWLNPNQNQTQMFQIVSNTATQVTVTGPIDSLVVIGQYYFILTERDSIRYSQVVKRLTAPLKEFAHIDINVHVLFA